MKKYINPVSLAVLSVILLLIAWYWHKNRVVDSDVILDNNSVDIDEPVKVNQKKKTDE